MSHQKEGVDFLLSKGSGGLFFEMRLGKSLTILETLDRLQQYKRILPVLIIAPLSVVPVWEQESIKFGYKFKFSNLIGTRANRNKAFQVNADIFVINYEGARLFAKELIAKNFKCIVCDESQKLKSIKAQQTRAIINIGEKSEHKFILSGTPVTKSPEDLWSQFHFIKPGFLGNFFAFRAKYIEFRKMTVRSKYGSREIQVPYRFKNLKELEAITSQWALRKTQAECFDLPEKSYKIIYCHMEGDQLKKYYQLKLGLQTDLSDKTLTVGNALTQIIKMQQVCNGFIYDGFGTALYLENNAKLKMLLDLLEVILEPKQDMFNPSKKIEQEKVVIFGQFKADLVIIKKALTEHGYKFVTYEGDDRFEAIQKFNESEDPMVFLSSIEVGKEGINLSSATQMIYYGRNYNYASRYQSEARIQSVISKKNLVYYDLICPNTIDEKVLEILKIKGETADKILGDSLRLAELECKE